MRLYIAVLDEFPDYMTPTLVAHAVLGAHLEFTKTNFDNIGFAQSYYDDWLENSFKKCVVRVNEKEFNKIFFLPNVYVAHEKNTLDGRDSCIVVCPRPDEELPNVLKFAKLWKPSPDPAALQKELNAYKEHFADENVMFDGEDLIWVN